ncbi:TipAS antibiotic-recognition domain-containing protein [Saxibacter everestensis]|uniref:TipAS antibiotic-recognition domain-containing protein n=1 Tax=Saxibacter everestensis TaxID=2909229 RepID=A0ABY8QVD7_9MICO|nr:TipAS antibiotic-recognition domain-containing protein [Brevibacteriaceae bacterium ZFBP1038]
MEWAMHDIVRTAGTTSRTLRHYDSIGLLKPSRVGLNGYRFYDQAALIRLQRILLLRELGLGLPTIAEVIAGERDPAAALHKHLSLLNQERERIDRQIASVTTTINKTERGEDLMASEAFDGFDHTQYKEEVEQRWGKAACADADGWWRSLSDDERRQHQRTADDLIAGFADASARGLDVTGDEVQTLAQRQYDWIKAGWGGKPPSAEAFKNLGQMYVDDPRFGKTYSRDGREFAAFVRDAMQAYAEARL